MHTSLIFSNKQNDKLPLAVILNKKAAIPNTLKLSKENATYAATQLKNENAIFSVLENGRTIYILVADEKKTIHLTHESLRNAGHSVTGSINKNKFETIQVTNASNIANAQLYVAEGIALSNYQFIKYFKESAKKKNTLKEVITIGDVTIKAEVESLNIVAEAL
jgi:leucyl aminopeptidase